MVKRGDKVLVTFWLEEASLDFLDAVCKNVQENRSTFIKKSLKQRIKSELERDFLYEMLFPRFKNQVKEVLESGFELKKGKEVC